MFCRERGFAHEDKLERRAAPAAPIVVGDVRELDAEVADIPEGAEEAKVPVELAVSEAKAEPVIRPFGPELDESIGEVKKEKMSRKGCMKASPAKIS